MALGGAYFFHDLFTKYINVFGTLFNNLEVRRTNDAGEVIKRIKVPIHYVSKEFYYLRVLQNKGLDKQTKLELPAMSFFMEGLSYDPNRQLPTYQKMLGKIETDNSGYNFHYTPTPWNLEFSLNVASRNISDLHQIVEQIIPFFKPSLTVGLKLLNQNISDDTFDIPIILNSISPQEITEGEQRGRIIMWTFSFTVKALLFGADQTENVIKTANTNLFVTSNTDFLTQSVTNEYVDGIAVIPGQFANGTPTTNADATVDVASISPESNYAFITTRTGEFSNT